MRLKCFIASAFNYSDVDDIFDNSIVPVAKELRITLLRVDRVEHNEDIDDKIISLMHESHFCIADLSYARPSVYFESGFIAGLGKPVVYICRNDHFKQRPDDPYGNFRVHFDLQMKNIITWTKPNKTFQERLRSRLKHLQKPILKQFVQQDKVRMENNEFQKLSTSDKLKTLRNVGIKLLGRHRYTIANNDGRIYFMSQSGVVGVKCVGRILSIAIVLPVISLTKKELGELYHTSEYLSTIKLPTKHDLNRGHTRITHVYYCSLRSIRFPQVAEVLSIWKPFPSENRIMGLSSMDAENWKYNIIDVHIIDRVLSERDLLSRLDLAVKRAYDSTKEWSGK